MTNDFNDKLNSILQNPQMMAQIKALADTMTIGAQTSPPESTPPAAEEEKNASQTEASTLDEEKTLAVQNPLIGNLLSPAFEENIKNTCALLRALKPFLDARRREKIDRVLNMIGLAQMAGKFGSLL